MVCKGFRDKEATTLLDYCVRTISICFDSTNSSNNIIWLSYTEREKTLGLTRSDGWWVSQPCHILTGFLCEERSPKWQRSYWGLGVHSLEMKKKERKLEMSCPISGVLDPRAMIWGWINRPVHLTAVYLPASPLPARCQLYTPPLVRTTRNVSSHCQIVLEWGWEAAKSSLVEKLWSTWKCKFIALVSFLGGRHLWISWPPNSKDLGFTLSSAAIVLWA